MDKNTKKLISVICIILGVVGIAASLYMAFTKLAWAHRGSLLILSLLVLVFGIYYLPTKKHSQIINVLFVFPVVFTFVITVILPFSFGVFYSMTDWNGVSYKNFVGLGNYAAMFGEKDYLYSFLITLLFTVFNMILVNLAGFTLALLCTANIKGKNFYRAAFFLPNLIGGIVLGYVWQFIFNKVFVMLFGGTSMLTDPNLAFISILIVSTWQYGGYIMMIYVTGLQTVPKEVMEASSIDGADYFTSLFKIKIPMIWNTFTVCTFLTLVNSFKQFDLNTSLTNGAPTRIINDALYKSTEFLALNIYNTAIAKNTFSVAQAKAVVFFILLAIISLTQVYISKKREVEM